MIAKASKILLLCASVVRAVDIKSICASQKTNELWPHENNCAKFYQCSNGKVIVHNCSAGLQFNVEKQICDWPQNVGCNKTSAEWNYAEQAALACAVTSSDGMLLLHSYCNKFYKCSYGVPHEKICPSNLLFNSVLKGCDWPENMKCGNRKLPLQNVTVNRNDSSYKIIAIESCAVAGSEGLILPHEDCEEFYECAAGIPVPLKCPSGLLYNTQIQKCDFLEKVECGDRKSQYANFIKHFNIIPATFEIKRNVTKSSDSIPITSNIKADDILSKKMCDQNIPRGVLFAHENCSQYYECDGEVPVAFNCPFNLLFNSQTMKCDSPENVDCDYRKQPLIKATESASYQINKRTRNRNLSAQTICAEENSEDILLPHERCDKFYQCTGKLPVAWRCLSGKLYNSQTQQCDYPKEVDCEDRQLPPQNETKFKVQVKSNVTDDDFCARQDSEGVLLPHKNCDEFYECAGGLPVALKCPPGLHYNSQTQRCDYPEKVDCGDRKPPPKNETESHMSKGQIKSYVSAQNICTKENSDGFLSSHENCDQFYKCSGRVPVPFKCPSNLLYNPEILKCDFIENVNCSDRNQPLLLVNTTKSKVIQEKHNGSAHDICAQEDSEGLFLPHENCDHFYECVGRAPVPFKCPSSLLYNHEILKCDFLENVDCGSRKLPHQNVTISTSPKITLKSYVSAQDACAMEGSEGLLLPHENCDEFYECAGGVPVSSKCPYGLLYNPDALVCDFLDVVVCGNRKQPPTYIPAEEACAGVGSSLLPHGNCDQFYECNGAVPVVLKCPSGLLYNNQTRQCDFEENVDCGDRKLPLRNITGQPKFKIEVNNRFPAKGACAAEGSEGLLLPHENCDQYYKCVGGLPIALRCPHNLLYNPRARICDWPENVGCGDRITPPKTVLEKNIAPPNMTYSISPNLSMSKNNVESENDTQKPVPASDVFVSYFYTDAVEACDKKDSEGRLLPHENCDQFFECSNRKPVAKSCPAGAGLLYNPEKQQCSFVGTVHCGERLRPSHMPNSLVVTTHRPKNASESWFLKLNAYNISAVKSCADQESDGLWMIHRNCEKFYECAKGRPIVFNCPTGLLYNSETHQCDWPESVDCDERILPLGIQSSLAEESVEPEMNLYSNAVKTCSEASSEGLLLPHDNCDKFYECIKGRPIAHRCPAGLLYNTEKQLCDRVQSVPCKRSREFFKIQKKIKRNHLSKTERESYKSAASKQCSKGGSDGLLLPHIRCDLFYECVNGESVTLDCPTAMLFDDEKQVCTRLDYVDCENRIHPEEEANIYLSHGERN